MSNSNKLEELIKKINEIKDVKKYLGLLEQEDNTYFWAIIKYTNNKMVITYYNNGEKKTEDLNKKTITLDEYFKKFLDSQDYLSNIHKQNFNDINEKTHYNECYDLLNKYKNIFKNKYNDNQKIENFFNEYKSQ
mgnify:CR=1 FL=1|tara:strand:+ start:1474 stop:1875 length:402 start_codon:yes stop_codon:yes gene_type:complete